MFRKILVFIKISEIADIRQYEMQLLVLTGITGGQTGSSIGTAVTGVIKTDDFLPSGISSGKSNGSVAGIGTTVGEKILTGVLPG